MSHKPSITPEQIVQFISERINQPTTDGKMKDSKGRCAVALRDGIAHSRPTILRGNMDRATIRGVHTPSDNKREEERQQAAAVERFTNFELLREVYGHCELNVGVLKEGSESKPPFTTTPIQLNQFFEECSNSEEFAKMHYLQQIELDSFNGKS